jgi:hypothetical protein
MVEATRRVVGYLRERRREKGEATRDKRQETKTRDKVKSRH